MAAISTGRVPASTDLLGLPYTFTQQRLLDARPFGRAAAGRGLALGAAQLEALHRERLLTPLFRVKRDRRAIASAVQRNSHLARQLARWTPRTRADLLLAREAGALFDPAHERFMARRQLQRELDGRTYAASEYLYSPLQLIALPLLRHVSFARQAGELAVLRPTSGRVWRDLVARAEGQRAVLLALLALEPRYWGDVAGEWTLPLDEDVSAFFKWVDTDAYAALRWLGLEAGWVRRAAISLLHEASSFDPLHAWGQLVARLHPSKWDQLRGPARNAIDLRIAAEMLFRYDEAEAGPSSESRAGVDRILHYRLKPQGSLDGVLTDFGLSPHPRLVLVLEGATELLLVPRVMTQLGVALDSDYIALEDAGGVDRDISPLLAYLAPRLEQQDEGYADLLRPPTRFLVVFDPEGKAATAELRRELRRVWVDRLMRTLPRKHQHQAVRNQLAQLVHLRTWRRNGENFELAHFTDPQLARAIAQLDRRRVRRPSEKVLVEAVASIRRRRGNLDEALRSARVSKRELAEAMWPVLEARVERALGAGTEQKIPVVRVVHTALTLANEFPRRGLAIDLTRASQPRGAEGRSSPETVAL